MGGSTEESAAGWTGQAEPGKTGGDDKEDEPGCGVAGYGFGSGSGGGAGGPVAAAEAGAVEIVSAGERERSGKTGCSDGSLAERSQLLW